MQTVKEPRTGDIIQVNDSSPKGTWKIARVVEIIESQVGKEQAATVMMPSKNILQRSTIQL